MAHSIKDNQTMIAVYPKGHGKGAIVMKRSKDAGLIWSDLRRSCAEETGGDVAAV